MVKCPQCDKSITRYNLSNHIKNVHNKCEQPKATCHICNKEMTKNSLRRHLTEVHKISH